MRSSRALAVLVLCCGTCSGSVLAAATEAAERCKATADDRARLACYDEIFGKPAGAGAQTLPAASAIGASVAAPHQQAAVPANPQADFGLSEAAKRERTPETAKASHPDSMSASVAAVSSRPTGEMIITLANGQVWVQQDLDTRAKVKTGDTVTITRAALGSFLLVTPSHAATRVKRVK